MYTEFLLIITAVIWLIFASITDIKSREVPDWISFSLIIISISLLLINSVNQNNFKLLIAPLIYGLIFTAISFVMYYTKQWGGGDTKLLIPLGIIFSSYPEILSNYFTPILNLPFPVIILINLLVIGTIYSLLYAFYSAVKNKNIFLKEFRKQQLKKAKIISIILVVVLIILSTQFEYPRNMLMIFLSIIVLVTPFLISAVKSVEKSCMIQKVSVNNLTEGDWIAENIYHNNKLILNKHNLGLTKKQITMIKKYKKEILVKTGIPFVPSFLVTIIISLIFGNLFIPF